MIDPKVQSLNKILLEFDDLRARLEEAESTLDAIRSGSVDALVVQSEGGEQVFTLRGADEPYRIFVERMLEGAVTLDGTGTILYCNKAFSELVGEPLERVIGSQIQTFLPTPEDELSPIDGLAVKGRHEAEIRRKGEPVPVLVSTFPVESGDLRTYAVTFTDLTPQKEHEAALQQATSELEGFCYSVSHDMRAPLRSMIGSASIVLEDFGPLLPKEGQQRLRRIAASARHLGKIMDDLLTYSRLAQKEVRAQPVDLSEIATRVATSIDETTERCIHWNVEPGLSIDGDPHLLELVLENLFSNAVKFSGQEVHPEIAFGRDRQRQAFFVRDNGIGFDMKYVGKLFLPFERLHRQEEFPGTGIGLANVKRIVARHGGMVWAEGEEGAGAAFFFTLP